MHPSKEIIFFTTASGAGYGLFALLGIFAVLNRLPPDRTFGACALLLAFALVTAGLLASTRHLGRPERMLLAFSQWRSSWLSREAVLAMFTYAPAAFFALGWIGFGHNRGMWADVGAVAALGAILTVFCTAMIYASLKAIPSWYSALVPLNYMALAVASGAVLLNLVAAVFHVNQTDIGRVGMVALIVALVLKVAYWASSDRKQVSTIGTATALGGIGQVRALDPPHTQPNYLQQEMGYRAPTGHRATMRGFTLFWCFFAPFFLLLVGRDSGSIAWSVALALIAVLSFGAGVVAERWLFFAEAKHQSSLYYGERSV